MTGLGALDAQSWTAEEVRQDLPVVSSRAQISFRCLLLACWSMPLACLNLHERNLAPYYVHLDATTIAKMLSRLLATAAVAISAMQLLRLRGYRTIYTTLFPWILFGLWATASTIWSPLKPLTAGHGAEVVLLSSIAAIAAITCDSERRISTLLLNLTLVGFLMTGILFVLYRDIVFDPAALLSGARPGGVLEANAMAGISGAYLVLLAGAALFGRWKWAAVLLVPGVVVHGLSIYVAHSRGAMAMTLLMLGFALLLLGGRKSMVGLLVLVAAGTAAIAMLPNPDRLADGVTAYVMRGQSADVLMNGSGRGELWSLAIRSFLDSPFLGHGYFVMSDSGLLQVWREEQWQTAHNIYLHVLTGTGIIGMTLFVSAILSLGRSIFSNLSAPGLDGKLTRLALIFAAYWIIGGIVELSLLGPVNPATFLFYIFIGLAAGVRQRRMAQVTTRRQEYLCEF